MLRNSILLLGMTCAISPPALSQAHQFQVPSDSKVALSLRRIGEIRLPSPVLDVAVADRTLAVIGNDNIVRLIHEWAIDTSWVIRTPSGTPPRPPLSAMWNEDSLALWFPSEGTIRSYDSQGLLLNTQRIPVDSDDLRFGWRYPSLPPRQHARALRFRDGVLIEAREASDEGEGIDVSGALIHFADQAVDTIVRFRTPSYAVPFTGDWLCCGPPRYFTPQPAWAVLPGGSVAFADGAAAEVLIYDEDGRLLTAIHWPASQETLGRVELWFGIRNLVQYMKGENALDSAVEAFRVLQSLPSVEYGIFPLSPAITQILTDDQGRIWIRRFDSQASAFGLSQRWDVLSISDGWIGYVDIPLTHVYSIRNGMILGSNYSYASDTSLIIGYAIN